MNCARLGRVGASTCSSPRSASASRARRMVGHDDEMIALAEENRRRAGATNVEFMKGEIENSRFRMRRWT